MNRRISIRNTPAPYRKIATTLVFLFFAIHFPATGYSGEFILLYSNDIRGETEPCG